MNTIVKFESAVTMLLVALGVAGCGGDATEAGYWEGEGHSRELLLKDELKALRRESNFSFWFVLDDSGEAVGEVDISYEAELRVDGLPKVTVSAPGGSVSFQPEVGGSLTDLDRSRTYPIVGLLDGDELKLMVATRESQRKPMEFTFRADPGVSASLGIGAGSVGVPGKGAGAMLQTMDMMPFDPFSAGGGEVSNRPGGPFVARFELGGSDLNVEWTARQVGGEQRDVDRDRVIEDALLALRQSQDR